MFALAARILGAKLTESTNRTFQVCLKKQIQSWIPVFNYQHNTQTGKASASLFKKWVKKRKK